MTSPIEINLQAIYDHSGNQRKRLFPGGDDIYRATVYKRQDPEFDVLYSEIDSVATAQ